jgi:glycosyltransferase involved in cell wall biosynthesis
MKKPLIELVLPVFNEEDVIEDSVVTLNRFMEKNCKFPWQITVFSNGSTDNTVEIGNQLSRRFSRVNFVHIPERGKAKAYKSIWPSSQASIVGFMDADLSTELEAIPKCIDAIKNGADIAIGDRHTVGALIERSLKRTMLSRGYNMLIKLLFPHTKVRDAHCGFKFLKKSVARSLLPHIRDDCWFFDTELLMLAEQTGHKIEQIPVLWVERKASKVRVTRVVTDYLFNLLKLRVRMWRLLFLD